MSLSPRRSLESSPVEAPAVFLSPLTLALLAVSVLVVATAVGWFSWQALDGQTRQVVITAPSGPLVSEGTVGDLPRVGQENAPMPTTRPASPTRAAPIAANVPTTLPINTPLIIYLPTMTPVPSETATPSATATPQTPPDLLTGLPTAAAVAQLRPYIVMIDNHPDAYPQSGLDKAAIVYEALAEGGITRFMAVFDGSSNAASEIGPVRSSRVYYIEWAEPYRALYVHAGGSPAALDLLWHVQMINTDLLSIGPSWRSSDRLAPHNLYTSAPLLKKWMATQGTQAADFSANRLLHKDDQPRPGPHPSISFDFGSISRSDVTWSYNPTNNSYLRWMWGAAHVDRITGQQLSAKNLVIIFTNRSDIIGDDKGRIEVSTSGGGDALFALDGKVVAGKWQKGGPGMPLRFLAANGAEMQFNRGNTWIEVLPIGQQVKYLG